MNTATNASTNPNNGRAIRMTELRDRDRKHFGRVHPGEVLAGVQATVLPGKCITLSGTVEAGRRYVKDETTGKYVSNEKASFFNHFRIGDIAEVGAYNLVYTGVIRKITAKTITVVEYDGHPGMEKTYVFSIYRFASKNWNFDSDEASERNANWTD